MPRNTTRLRTGLIDAIAVELHDVKAKRDALAARLAEAVGLLMLARNGTIPHATRYEIDKFLDRAAVNEERSQGNG